MSRRQGDGIAAAGRGSLRVAEIVGLAEGDKAGRQCTAMKLRLTMGVTGVGNQLQCPDQFHAGGKHGPLGGQFEGLVESIDPLPVRHCGPWPTYCRRRRNRRRPTHGAGKVLFRQGCQTASIAAPHNGCGIGRLDSVRFGPADHRVGSGRRVDVFDRKVLRRRGCRRLRRGCRRFLRRNRPGRPEAPEKSPGREPVTESHFSL